MHLSQQQQHHMHQMHMHHMHMQMMQQMHEGDYGSGVKRPYGIPFAPPPGCYPGGHSKLRKSNVPSHL